MVTPNRGTLNDPRHQPVLRRLALLLGCSCYVGATLAHPNAVRVSDAILSACGSSSSTSSSACSPGFTDEERSDLAPDKFVMQSVAAFGAVSQQVSLVGRRLDELRHAKFGGHPTGFSGARGVNSVRPVITLSALGHAPVPAAAAAKPPPGTPVMRAQGRALLLASTSTALPYALVAQNNAQDSSPSVEQSAPAGASGSAAFPSTDLGLYFRVAGDKGHDEANTFDPGFRSRSAGLTVGADYKVSTNAVLGGALNYNDDRSTLDTSNGTPSGTVKTRGTGVSLYGAYYPTATAYVDATLVYGRNRYESLRSILSLNDSAIGSTNGSQYGASLGAGYSFLVSNVSFGPYARLSSSKVDIDAFTEQANFSGTHLAVQEQSAESVVSVLGGQISYAISRNWGVLIPNARIEWEHQYEDDRTGNIRANFADPIEQLPALINIETAPPDRNYFNLGLGLASHFGVGRSAFVYYQTLLGKEGTRNHALTAELRLEF